MIGHSVSVIVGRVMRSRETVATIVAAMSLAVIIYATLSPFLFELHALTWQAYLGAFDLPPASLFDFPRNIVLFVPLGGALALLVRARAWSWWTAMLVATAAGAATSVGVETLQIFLPARTTNVSDVIGNTLGSVIGGGVSWWTLHPARSALFPAPTRQRVAGIAFGLYLLMMLGLTWALMWSLQPSRWDTASRLAPGYTYSSERPWRGRLETLLILDRAVDEADAARLAAGEVPGGVQASVVLADLSSDGRCSRCATAFDDDAVASRINRSGEFTVVLTVATFDVNQPDAGPIIATSPDPSRENLVLKQDEGRLVLGWRSLLTAANDMEPELEFTDVFTSLEPFRVVVSFDGVHARVVTAKAATTLFVSPQDVFSAMLREVNVWSTMPTWLHWWVVAAPLPAFMFIPLGMLMARAVGGFHQPGHRMALTAIGCVIPALLLEGFVAAYRNGSLRVDIVALGIGFSGLGLVVAQLRPWSYIAGVKVIALRDAAQAG